MFRNLIKRNDKDKGPPSGVGGGSDQPYPNETDIQGFLCPMCMKSYPNPEVLQAHFDAQHGDKPEPPDPIPPRQPPAAFPCPICKMAHSSAQLLQNHYEQVHVHGDKHHVNNDIRTPLENSSLSAPGLPPKLKDAEELEMFRQQLRASEESRTLLASEVILLRDQLSDLKETHSSMCAEKSQLEHKAATQAGDIVMSKAKADEYEGQKIALEDHIITLKQQFDENSRYTKSIESQLAQRPGADDVLVLKKELIHAQTLMDRMTQDTEKDRVATVDDNKVLQARILEIEATNQELQRQLREAPKFEQVQMLQSSLNQTSSGSEKLNQVIEAKDDLLKEKEGRIINLERQLRDQASSITDLTQQTEQHNNILAESASKLTESSDKLRDRDGKIDELAKQLKELKQSSQQLAQKMKHGDSKMSLVNRQLTDKDSRMSEILNQMEVKDGHITQLVQQIQDRDKTIISTQNQAEQANTLVKDRDQLIARSEHEIQGLKSSLADLELNLHNHVEVIKEKQCAIEERDSLLEDKSKEICSEKDKMDDLMQKVTQLELELKQRQEITAELIKTQDTEIEQNLMQVKLDGAEAMLNQNKRYEALESQKAQAEKELKAIQNTIKHTTAELQKTQSQLETDVAKLKSELQEGRTEAHTVQKQLKDKISSLEEQHQKAIGDNEVIQKRLEETKTALLSSQQQLRELTTSFATQTSTVSEKLKIEQMLREELSCLERDRSGLEEDKQVLEERVSGLDMALGTIRQQLVEQSEAHTRKLSEMSERQDMTSDQLQQREEELKQVQRQLGDKMELCQRLETDMCDVRKKLEAEINQLKNSLQEVNTKYHNLEEDARNREVLLNEQILTCNQTTEDIRAKLTQTEQELENLTSLKNTLQADKVNLEAQLKEMGEKRTAVTCERDALLAEKESLNHTKSGLVKDKDSLHDEKTALLLDKQSLTQEKEGLLTEKQTLSDTISTLTNENKQLDLERTALKTTLETEKIDTAKVQSDFDLYKKAAHKEEERLQKEKTDTHQLIEIEKARAKTLESQKQEVASQNSSQMTALNENITTLRADLNTAHAKLQEITKTYKQLHTEKLDLDDKLEHNADERRLLLERCLESEAHSQKLQSSTTELRRKLDDCQAGLQELGRENQSLQIVTNKTVSRKWTSDDEITSCMSCDQLFSVTVRRHHCRNCGGIFCYECSQKTARIASAKNPVRVCDVCSTEISQRS